MSNAKRLHVYGAELDLKDVKADPYGEDDDPVAYKVTPEDEANLVSSLTNRGTHLPCFDVDLPVRVIPSSTPGHYHLYIEKEISWQHYYRLLGELMRTGIISRGYYNYSIKRKQTFVRKPGIYKINPDDVRAEDRTARFYADKAQKLFDENRKLQEEVTRLRADLQEARANQPGTLMTWS